MLTIGLACIHAKSNNSSFQPLGLYFVTFIVDLSIVEAAIKIFGVA